MGYQSEADAIQIHFLTQWADRTPVGYPGANFTPSDESVQLDFLSGEGQAASAGSPGTNLARYVGVLAVRVYTEPGRNVVHSREIADQVCDVFRNAELGSILFRVPYISGSRVEGAWRVTTVMCRFYRDEFHA